MMGKLKKLALIILFLSKGIFFTAPALAKNDSQLVISNNVTQKKESELLEDLSVEEVPLARLYWKVEAGDQTISFAKYYTKESRLEVYMKQLDKIKNVQSNKVLCLLPENTSDSENTSENSSQYLDARKERLKEDYKKLKKNHKIKSKFIFNFFLKNE